MPLPNPPDDRAHAGNRPPAPPSALQSTGRGSGTVGGARPGSSAAPARIGRFEVRKVLGEGAFGRVYLAFDPQLAREVAVKVPHAEELTPAFRDRFLREARATAAIHHPNVCPVFEAGTDGDLPFIVMRFVAGSTLAAMLDAEEPLPVRSALIIARKLALGVAAAHECGVVHRDLKPQNVLFDPKGGEVLITDFGLARVATESRRTADGSVLGTPAYMSPEQARGQVNQIGSHSDIYRLGVILYRMLTGEVPFRGSTFEVLAQHANAAPMPPSKVRPSLDPPLDALVLKAMAKNPAGRYVSAKEFADALANCMRSGRAGSATDAAEKEGASTDAKPVSRPQRTAPASGKSPTADHTASSPPVAGEPSRVLSPREWWLRLIRESIIWWFTLAFGAMGTALVADQTRAVAIAFDSQGKVVNRMESGPNLPLAFSLGILTAVVAQLAIRRAPRLLRSLNIRPRPQVLATLCAVLLVASFVGLFLLLTGSTKPSFYNIKLPNEAPPTRR